MQFKLDKKLLMYIIYTFITAILVFISYNIVFHFDTIMESIKSLISYIFTILTPLIIGIVIAYLLYPLTRTLNNFLAKTFKMNKKPYLLSVILTYVFVVLFIILLIYSVYVLIGGKIIDSNAIKNTSLSMMLTTISGYIARYNELFEYINNKIIESGLPIDLKSYINQAITQISRLISLSFNNIFRFSKGFGISIINGLLGLFISFYLLKDYEFFGRIYNKIMLLFFSREKLSSINSVIGEINQVVSRFIRGQLLDSLIVGLLSSIGLTIIGLDFAIIIGFAAGIANIIPYIGPIVGSIPAIIIGILSPNPMVAVWAVVVFVIVQQLDSIVISPKIVGDSIGLHPVFIILAITIGGSVAGILGMLLSVPILGVIKLFVSKYIDKRQIV